MYNELYTAEYEWKGSEKGNFVAISPDGNHVATVFSKTDTAWQIIINVDGDGHIVEGEVFTFHWNAQERAEAILNGADCTLTLLPPKSRPVATEWKIQRKTSNDSPTYGRKHYDVSVSVKKAASGQWYYVIYAGSASKPPQGWYGSAEEAMQAFDILYPR